MTPETALQLVIRPTLAFMGGKYATVPAQHMLVATGLQESAFDHRKQIGGPAHSYWQFERAGVKGVLMHRATGNFAIHLCRELDHPEDLEGVYQAMQQDAILACVFARLLLYTDPKPLPLTKEDGWGYYLRLWRPGKPHPTKWPANWMRAEQAIKLAKEIVWT